MLVQTVNDGLSASQYLAPDISLTEFKQRIYSKYEHAPHLEELDYVLTQVSRYVETRGTEGIGRVLISMPPRHGKSTTVSRLYPAWHIGRNPDHRVMLVSYGDSLTRKHSRVVRNYLTDGKYAEIFNGVHLARDSKDAMAWDVADFEGGMDALGIDGAATGKGAHVLIVDDALKNRAEAESEVMREKVWDAFTDDLYTRLEPGGAVVGVGTRWHQDDWIGRCIARQPDKWYVLKLPAINEQGEALWPARYPIAVLRDIQETLAPYSWSAEYQQNPVPAEGGVFKRAWFEPLLNQTPEIVRSVRAWDLAMSEKTSADYTVGVKIGEATDGHYYLLDVARKQLEWGDVTPFIAETILNDGADVVQGIEEKGFMSRAITELNQDPRLRGYAIFGYPVDKDKLTRALPFAAKCAAGLVHTVNAHWSQAYVEEMCSFPNGMHDDCVDASSMAWVMIGESNYMGGLNYAPETTFSASNW